MLEHWNLETGMSARGPISVELALHLVTSSQVMPEGSEPRLLLGRFDSVFTAVVSCRRRFFSKAGSDLNITAASLSDRLLPVYWRNDVGFLSVIGGLDPPCFGSQER